MRCLLIGVSHGYQYAGNASVDAAAFLNFLREMQALHRADLLGEELNSEAIDNTRYKGVTGSVAQEVAKEAGIRHLFCDPTQKERQQLGIPSRQEIIERLGYKGLPCLTPQQDMDVRVEEKKYWETRERFWLGKLVESPEDLIMFVLGACHINRFQTLLYGSGHDSKILIEHWKP